MHSSYTFICSLFLFFYSFVRSFFLSLYTSTSAFVTDVRACVSTDKSSKFGLPLKGILRYNRSISNILIIILLSQKFHQEGHQSLPTYSLGTRNLTDSRRLETVRQCLLYFRDVFVFFKMFQSISNLLAGFSYLSNAPSRLVIF